MSLSFVGNKAAKHCPRKCFHIITQIIISSSTIDLQLYNEETSLCHLSCRVKQK